MSTDKSERPKKEFKSYEDLHAWKIGQELSISLEMTLQEYRDDPYLRDWCLDMSMSLRDAMVQLIEGFYKHTSPEKCRRYDAALFYLHRLAYTLKLGEGLGWWQVAKLHPQVEELAKVVRQTRFHFVERRDKVETNSDAVVVQSS